MCAGPEILAAAQIASAVVGTVAGVKALTAKAPSPQQVGPSGSSAEVIRQDPVAQEVATQTTAAQEGDAQKLATRQRARANSLLSQAGGAGDLSTPSTTRGGAKALLGA